jgi:hypothetical protein
LIIDLRNDVSDRAIDAAVDEMRLARLDRFMTRATFKHVLRKRAYSRGDFADMAKAAPFTDWDIIESAIGFEVRLTK